MRKLLILNRKNLLKNDPELAELFDHVMHLKKKLSDLFKEKYDRALPFNELVFDRWEKAIELGFGEGTSIYDSSIVLGDVSVGVNTWIGPNTLLDGTGKLTIGNNCSISANVQIYTHDTVKWAVSGGIEPYEYAATNIGNNCYVGPNSVIAKGVTIGDNVVIGANSFVNKNLVNNKRYAGSPAIEIKE